VLYAPGFEEGALEIVQRRESLRILCGEEERPIDPAERDLKRVQGGLLIQDRDGDPEPREIMEALTARQPTEREWDDMLFAWTVCRRVRSNAIVIARDGATLGIGAGQMSRVDSVRLGGRLRRLLPLRRRARAGDRGRLDRGDPARRLQKRRRRDRRLRRGGRRDGLHQAPPLPPLSVR